jgi:parallel beta-helix repeat protein
MNATIQGNTLIGNPNGIVIYDGCYGCTIKGNILNNSREIILRAVDESLDPSVFPEGRRLHEVAMNVSILNNTISNTAGTRPAYVALDVEAFQPASYSGMGMMNIQMGGNTINVYSANPSLSYANPVQTEVTQEGFFPCFMYGPAKVKAPVTTVFQDIYFWNNTLSATVTYPPAFLPLTTQACVTSSAPSAQ